MRNSLAINEFSTYFEPMLLEGRLEEAASIVFNISHRIKVSGRFRGEFLRLPELDHGLVRLANRLKAEFPAPSSRRNEHVCIASEVYKIGGHRTILNSVCREIPSHVIFTDIFEGITSGTVRLRDMITASALSSITLNANKFIDKVRSAVNLLNGLSPSRIWLFSHHQDVVALLAALIFDGGRRTIYVHHCDHEPALGATIKFPVHFDFTDEALENCASIGIESSKLALYCPQSTGRACSPNVGLIVVTGGSFGKFSGSLQGILYQDVVKEVLRHPHVTCFYHVGDVSSDYTAELQAFLRKGGVDPERLKFVGQVASVSEFALSVGANVFLSSFPISAAATTAELQSAGLPVLYFNPDRSSMPLCAVTSIFGSRELAWDRLDDIHPVLDLIFKEWALYSDAAFTKYQTAFSRDIFLQQIEPVR